MEIGIVDRTLDKYVPVNGSHDFNYTSVQNLRNII